MGVRIWNGQSRRRLNDAALMAFAVGFYVLLLVAAFV